MHDLRLLHTDIKPDNLFLDDNDNVLVGDLGLAALMDAHGNGHPAGSTETMAPEVAQAHPTTVRTDVYSLGATLYELLAGHPMNPSLAGIPNRADAYEVVASHTPTPLGDVAPHVPVGLRTIVMRAISVNASERYASVADLAAVLGARSRPRRTWTRDAPCAGHAMCFSGVRAGASTLKVCAEPTGGKNRHVIASRRVPAGTRTNLPWPEATPAQLVARVRARLQQLT